MTYGLEKGERVLVGEAYQYEVDFVAFDVLAQRVINSDNPSAEVATVTKEVTNSQNIFTDLGITSANGFIDAAFEGVDKVKAALRGLYYQLPQHQRSTLGSEQIIVGYSLQLLFQLTQTEYELDAHTVQLHFIHATRKLTIITEPGMKPFATLDVPENIDGMGNDDEFNKSVIVELMKALHHMGVVRISVSDDFQRSDL